MENQDQVQPRRSQRQRKFVDRLQLDFRRRRQSKSVDYRKLQREIKEKRKREIEENRDSQNPESKKAKFQEAKNDDQSFAAPQKNYDAAGKPIYAICKLRNPSPNFCEIFEPGVGTKKFRTVADFEMNIFYY